MTAAPQAAPPEFEPTPFFSPRNVPLWMGLVLALVVAALIRWVP